MKKEKKEAIRKKAQNSTAKFLGEILRKEKVKTLCDSFVFWAENHRKKMFAITITFLVSVFIITIVTKPSKSFVQVYNDEGVDSVKTNTINQKQTAGLKELFDFKKMQEEIKELEGKKELTQADTLKILELYNKLKEIEK